jgi:hypothetical protein
LFTTMTTKDKPKPLFSLMLEPMNGADPLPLAQDAQRIADQLGVMAEYNFNGVRCIAYPSGNPAELHRQTMLGLHNLASRAGFKNAVAIS